MPCTITDAELEAYERQHNLQTYGHAWLNAELATAVACWLSKNIQPGVQVPPYVAGWIAAHDNADNKRWIEQGEQPPSRTASW